MNRNHLFIFSFFCIVIYSKFFISECVAQSGCQIRIKTENIQADSLFVSAYHVKEKKFMPFLSLKFTNDMMLKNSTPLDAGIYTLFADSNMFGEFIISDKKHQKFTIHFLKDDIIIKGSKENSSNREYIKKMREFSYRMGMLSKELQQKKLLHSVKQAYLDALLKKIDTLNTEKRAYQERIIAKNPGTLLASIIQCSVEIEAPPPEYYNSQIKLLTYLSTHFFDFFTWDDERLLKTPVLYNKFKIFAQQISYLDSDIAIPIVVKGLNDSKKNSNFYSALFDFLEYYFGNYKSPELRDEKLYLAMLENALEMKNLDEVKKKRFETEFHLLNRNLPGMQATDFNILLHNGDTTTLYQYEAEILILYFQNPDCHTCSEFRNKLNDMKILFQAINAEKVKVMTVYFEKEEKLWRNYLEKDAFTNWTHGWNYDYKISEKHLYDVRSIPTIMILDKNKMVIKKDIFPKELEEWMKQSL